MNKSVLCSWHELSPTHEQTDAQTDAQTDMHRYASTKKVSKDRAVKKKNISITTLSHQLFSEFNFKNVWFNSLILNCCAFYHIRSYTDFKFIPK